MILLAAALSASFASPLTKSRLSVLTLFLTSLFADVRSFWAATFAALVRLLLTAPFLSFLICIFLIGSAEIQSFVVVSSCQVPLHMGCFLYVTTIPANVYPIIFVIQQLLEDLESIT